VVVTQFKDLRDHPGYLGEGYLAGGTRVARHYRAADDPTWVMPKVLGGYLKRVGFNVTYADRLGTFEGDQVREVLDRYQADYLIAGRLEQFDVRVFGTQQRPALAVIGLRLDVYNRDGRLRMYYPAPLRNAGFLNERADDPAAVAHFVNEAVQDVYRRAFENSYFVKTLDLDVDTIRDLMKARPAPPAEAVPVEGTEGEGAEGEETVPEGETPAGETTPAPAAPDETTSEGTSTAPAPTTNPAPDASTEVNPTTPAPVNPTPALTEEEKRAIEEARRRREQARELEDAIRETE
jgi:hypothetical protein